MPHDQRGSRPSCSPFSRKSQTKDLSAPFRIAAVLLLIFCAGHTAGGMFAQKSLGVASDTVFALMKNTHFHFNGADCTWYGFWFGFGLMVSVFLVLSAFIAWHLGGLDARHWPVMAPIAWALLAGQVVNAVLSWKYFFAGPGILSVAVVLLLAAGILRMESRALKKADLAA